MNKFTANNEPETPVDPETRGFGRFKGIADLVAFYNEIREHGVISAFRLVGSILPSRLYWRFYYYYHLPIDRKFDDKHGVDTCGILMPSSLTIESANKGSGLEYEPTPVKAFPNMLVNLPNDLSEFAFVDFGSGKGRTLLLASQYNFKKIIGVEYAEELHQIANKNIAAYRSENQQCFDIKSVCTDAVQFPIPQEKCLFYFYYPFNEQVMSNVLDSIRESYNEHPRKMYFINRLDKQNWAAICKKLFGSLHFVRPMKSTRPLFSLSIMEPWEVVTYETLSDY